MFERFTDRARQAVVLAQEEAGGLAHNYLGTEHLLLGLLRGGPGTSAGRVLESAGIGVDAVRSDVTTIVGRGQQPPSGHIRFTARAKKALELAMQESKDLGHRHIGTGHLLIGLIRQDDGLAVQILDRLGANRDGLREQAAADPSDGAEGQEAPGPTPQAPPPRPLTGIEMQLRRIELRLAAIEQHLGIGPEEAGALRAEVDRLRVLLRQHGIDPDEAVAG